MTLVSPESYDLCAGLGLFSIMCVSGWEAEVFACLSVCLCMSMGLCTPLHMCGGQRTIFWEYLLFYYGFCNSNSGCQFVLCVLFLWAIHRPLGISLTEIFRFCHTVSGLFHFQNNIRCGKPLLANTWLTLCSLTCPLGLVAEVETQLARGKACVLTTPINSHYLCPPCL